MLLLVKITNYSYKWLFTQDRRISILRRIVLPLCFYRPIVSWWSTSCWSHLLPRTPPGTYFRLDWHLSWAKIHFLNIPTLMQIWKHDHCASRQACKPLHNYRVDFVITVFLLLHSRVDFVITTFLLQQSGLCYNYIFTTT